MGPVAHLPQSTACQFKARVQGHNELVNADGPLAPGRCDQDCASRNHDAWPTILTDQPVPEVRVRPGLAFFSMKLTILLAISNPVAFSMPSSPGEELTSMTTGP